MLGRASRRLTATPSCGLARRRRLAGALQSAAATSPPDLRELEPRASRRIRREPSTFDARDVHHVRHRRIRRIVGGATPFSRRREPRAGAPHVRRHPPSRAGRRGRLGRATASALGMRRLSIIDLSTGHQPIHNEDGTVWIVFNGEIYNFRELRARARSRRPPLLHLAPTPKSIVHAYEQWGEDAIAPAARDVRPRDLGSRSRGRCSSRATASASSRCYYATVERPPLLRIRAQVAARARPICRAISIPTRSITTCRSSTRRATDRSSRASASCRPATC